nr:LysR substrate-binding domain-containing protein [Cedecea davisae]
MDLAKSGNRLFKQHFCRSRQRNITGNRQEVWRLAAAVCKRLRIVTLARSGAGLVQTYQFIVEQDLADGSLVELLPEYGGSSRPFILLYPHARHLSLRVRCLVDFLALRLGT